ncbi:argininosuccinate lyase [Desulfitispora alkaliphila]|uniref:hypothetical protein n=1 Tax=Desulfitispora alkaliphila TaxID=622674 RepID=UPI003D1A2675
MQEDKEPLFDSVDTVKKALVVFTPMISTLKVNGDNMERGAKGGFTNATDVADYLVKKGLTFREAHEIVGKMVACCLHKGVGLDDLTMAEYKLHSEAFKEDVFRTITLETCVNERRVTGGPAEEAVAEAIALMAKKVEQKQPSSSL